MKVKGTETDALIQRELDGENLHEDLFRDAVVKQAQRHRIGVERLIFDAGRRGHPDVTFWYYGHVLKIEMKRLRGGRVSPHQERFIEKNMIHCPTYVTRGIVETLEVLNKWLHQIDVERAERRDLSH